MSDSTMPAPDAVDHALHRVEELPTLNTVAVRLLDLTADEDSSAREVIQLLESDPALAAKIVKICRCSDRGRGARITGIDRAVVLLGFQAVRSIALSVQFFALMEGLGRDGGAFDRSDYWRHCIATAVAAQDLALRSGRRVDPSEAHLAGLLHDLGQLALHALEPEAFDRVIRSAELAGESIDAACRRGFGLDSHTVGRRIAEHWRLPQRLINVIWLNGATPEGTVPEEDRPLVELVTLADHLARDHHLAPTFQPPTGVDVIEAGASIGLAPEQLERIAADLHRSVSEHGAALGLGEEPPESLLLASLGRANRMLARANSALRSRGEEATPHLDAARCAERFLAEPAATEGRSVDETLGAIARSVSAYLSLQEVAIVRPPRGGMPWRLDRFDAHGGARGATNTGGDRGGLPTNDQSRLRKLAAQMLRAEGTDDAELLLLATGDRVEAAVAAPLSATEGTHGDGLRLLIPLWTSALASALRSEESGRLAERFAESGRSLLEAQEQLTRARSLASVGEMAAGAAHEMNNPLTVIRGRAQLLAGRLADEGLRRMAGEIADSSAVLSDLITALRHSAEPIHLRPDTCDLAQIVRDAIARAGGTSEATRVRLRVEDDATASVDAALLTEAFAEVIDNALGAIPDEVVEVRIQTDPLDGRWILHVADRGPGLTELALAHAFDPFFSEKSAGRRTGLGLARARQLVEAHGGRITVRNSPELGAVATIVLPAPVARPQRTRREVA